MRTSRFALASCTALLGLGSLVSQAMPSAAGTPPKQGTIVLDQSGDSIDDFGPAPTIPKPDYGDFDIVLPPMVDPDFDPELPDLPGMPDVPESEANDQSQDDPCLPGSTVPPGCQPPCTEVPGGPDCPGDDDPCRPDSTKPGTPDEQCPPEDDCPPVHAARAQIPPTVDDCDPCEERPDSTPRLRAEDPCDPCVPGDVIARNHADPCDPCEPENTDGPVIARHRDDDCEPCIPEGSTDGGPTRRHEDSREDCPGTGTTGGTDGSDGRLPKTGGDVAQLLGAGVGLTALGAALRRIARR